MHRHRLVSTFVLAVVFAIGGVSLPAAAQDATPAAILWATTPPGPPDPSLCHAATVQKDRYLALRSTPIAVPPAPYDLFSTPVGQIGTPADQTTIDAVTATIMEFGACVNAGQWINNANLYTDAGFAEDHAGIDDGFLDFIGSGTQPASLDETYYIFAVSSVRILEDGRVGAVIQFGQNAMYGADYLIFAKTGDRYLIDYWVDEFEAWNVPTSGTLEATPSA